MILFAFARQQRFFEGHVDDIDDVVPRKNLPLAADRRADPLKCGLVDVHRNGLLGTQLHIDQAAGNIKQMVFPPYRFSTLGRAIQAKVHFELSAQRRVGVPGKKAIEMNGDRRTDRLADLS